MEENVVYDIISGYNLRIPAYFYLCVKSNYYRSISQPNGVIILHTAFLNSTVLFHFTPIYIVIKEKSVSPFQNLDHAARFVF